MPLCGFTGAADDELIGWLKSSLAHRGSLLSSESIAGERIINDGEVTVAFSGSVRRGELTIDAYRREGIAWAESLDGEFVLAIGDGNTLHLVRDAVGGRTAYYGRVGDRWVVASEPKAIWSLPGFQKRLRPAAIAQYFSFSFIPGEGTMLEDLFEVPAGCRVELRTGEEPQLFRYFDPLDIEPQDEDPAVWPKRFQTLLEEEVGRRLRNGESPAVFLSGGLDSSVVTAELARQSPHPVQSFATHFGKKYPDELMFARRVAERCGTVHYEVEIRPQFVVSDFRQMIWHLDEPVGDPVTMPNYRLARHVARMGVREVFNGEGGDPLFGGPKNIPMMLDEWYGGVGTSRDRAKRYLASYRRSYRELHALLSSSLREQIDESLDLELLLTPTFEREGSLLHKLLAINTTLKGAHLILPKVERMLAASQVAPLSPLFTRGMVELAFASPPRAKLQGGCEKWLMKQAYRDLIPAEVIARPKSGMRVPVHYWFKGPLRRFARKVLSRRELERVGLFNADRVRQWLRYDIGQANGRYGLRIWMLITFELWRRMVFESDCELAVPSQ